MARSNDAPLSPDEQKRLKELQDKGPRGLSDKENTEVTELEARARRAERAQQGQPVAAQGDRPRVGEAAGAALNVDEVSRMHRLQEKRAEAERTKNNPLSPEEQADLDALERRTVPQAAALTDQVQRDLSPNRPVQPPGEVAKDDANRLRDLRVAAERGTLSDADRAEMGKLSLAESEYAGHVTAEEGKETGEGLDLADELVFLIEQMVSLTPAFRNLEPRLRALRQRLNEERAGVAGGQPIRPSSMQPQQPGPNP